MSESEVLLVFTNAPDADSARHIARSLIDARLAACVNVLAPCTSLYRWQGEVEASTEVPLLIKSTRTHYAALEAAIRLAHPYELPEIVAVPVERGLPGYLAWVTAETTPPAPHT
ncbi:divalent-cation tolerance protein CutA [Pseudothauera lacus]|uniref:Divalent-cation tolerance protein CutA n=1 Tax=Pseudothauera lacus TaxID=2136175 RepID=A0A2T4IEN0_9RHOO|nr:divalent-cation tolerance protein CutA [Pseudothauera lacus]PTD96208.1 divalent-cation tolerance protein CutA [Pseudothauera lacus]